MRTIRLEIAMDGDRVVAAACTEVVAPLRGHWRRWSMRDQTRADRITTTTIIKGLRDVIANPSKDSRHG